MAFIEPVTGKLLATAATEGDVPVLFRCNADGNGCTYSALSASNWTGSTVATVLDIANGRLLAITRYNVGGADRPNLFRCSYDGSGCASLNIPPTSTGRASSAAPST